MGRDEAGVRGGGALRSRSSYSSSPPLHGLGRRRVIMEVSSFVFPFLICFVISHILRTGQGGGQRGTAAIHSATLALLQLCMYVALELRCSTIFGGHLVG